MRFASKLALAAMFTAALSLMNPAMAGCRRMGFTVNDYGLEGPKRDAQNLLDKHIAEWAAEQGIEKYNVGKKDVSCELYLNLIVFDEHTCTATATVCWGDSINRAQPQTASTKSKSAPAKKEAAPKSTSSETEQPAAEQKKAAEAAPSRDEAEEEKAAAAASPEETEADETKSAEAVADESEVETGAIPVPPTAAGAAAAVSPLTAESARDDETATADATASESSSTESSAADDATAAANSAAAAAAEAAAAAAERAASAAERAAKAAERAAAALADIPKASPSSTASPAATETPASSSGAPTGYPGAAASPTP